MAGRNTKRLFRSVLHGFHRRGRAVAAVEFALLAPVFLIAFGGVADLGAVLYLQIRLESALAIGTNYALLPANIAMVNSTNGATLALNIANLVGTAFTSTNSSNPFLGNPSVSVVVNNGPTETKTSLSEVAGGTSAPADSYYCPSGSAPSWTWGSAVAQGSSCTGGGAAGKFVSITANYTYTTFFPYGFVHNGAMTLGAMVQVQ